MKKVTFFIGNGFDCKNELKTRYNYFLDWYMEHNENDSDLINCFKKELKSDYQKTDDGSNYGKWSYLEKQMGLYDPGSAEKFIECYDDIYSHIVKYIQDQDQKKYNDDINEGRNLDELPSGLKRFLTRFYSFSSNNGDISLNIEKVFKNEKWEFNFISLNYTELIIDCVKKMKDKVFAESSFPEEVFDNIQIGRCLNPHGTLPNVVFGVSNEHQLINKNYYCNYEFRKRMIKHEQADFYGITDFNESIDLIDNSDIICLFGVAIGETDDHWWNRITKWLNENEKHCLIVYDFESDEKKRGKKEVGIIDHLSKFDDHYYNINKQIAVTFDEQKFAETFIDVSVRSQISLNVQATIAIANNN